MKKLKGKVFLVIFLILTMFLVTILVVSNYQNYKSQIDNIKTTLFRMDETRNIMNNVAPIIPLENANAQPRIFMDSHIYAVRLDAYNNVIDIPITIFLLLDKKAI